MIVVMMMMVVVVVVVVTIILHNLNVGAYLYRNVLCSFTSHNPKRLEPVLPYISGKTEEHMTLCNKKWLTKSLGSIHPNLFKKQDFMLENIVI